MSQLSTKDISSVGMNREAQLYDQINNVRNSRLNLEQNTLRLREQLTGAESQMEILRSRYARQ